MALTTRRHDNLRELAMKVQVFSDAHVDFPGSRGLPPLVPGAQLVIAAGDTCEGLVNALKELRRAYPAPAEIVAVAGNHEFYGAAWAEEIETGIRIARELNIHFLENDVVILGSLRIVGATLWTDYDLFGERLREAAMVTARDIMRDHRRIKWQKSPWLRFRPIEAGGVHIWSREFIVQTLSMPHDGPTLVVTHHAPCFEAIPCDARDDLISAAYASNLYSIIDRFQPDYWISGHTHVSMDLQRGRTRLISNPVGYAGENASYDPRFCLEIDA
jgi:predicted phosphodiesterase